MLKKMVTMAAKYTHVQEEMKKKPIKMLIYNKGLKTWLLQLQNTQIFKEK